MTSPGTRSGLFDTLRQLLDTGLAAVIVRLELFGTEFEQEKQRMFVGLLQAALGLLLLGLALALLIVFALLLVSEGYRLHAVGVLCVAFTGAALWLLRLARAQLRSPPGGAFALSLRELRRDREGLGSEDQ